MTIPRPDSPWGTGLELFFIVKTDVAYTVMTRSSTGDYVIYRPLVRYAVSLQGEKSVC